MQAERSMVTPSWLDEMERTTLPVDKIPDGTYGGQGIECQVLRADTLHPVCSGNKFFKLRLFLQDAIQKNHTTLLTEGGPWSNHLVATAFAARACGLKSIGVVNGWPLRTPSQALEDASHAGMELIFRMGRNLKDCLNEQEVYHIPAGGAGSLGVQGAAGILKHVNPSRYTHILCAVGTGTMLAGLMLAAGAYQPGLSNSSTSYPPGVYGVSVLKHENLEKEVLKQLASTGINSAPCIIRGFEEGGYARTSEQLLSFMNQFYTSSGIPTDIVYTGKLMFAIHQMISHGRFAPGSSILAIHSGGLQGNRSLKKGELVF